jgi:hypothetical protein
VNGLLGDRETDRSAEPPAELSLIHRSDLSGTPEGHPHPAVVIVVEIDVIDREGPEGSLDQEAEDCADRLTGGDQLPSALRGRDLDVPSTGRLHPNVETRARAPSYACPRQQIEIQTSDNREQCPHVTGLERDDQHPVLVMGLDLQVAFGQDHSSPITI